MREQAPRSNEHSSKHHEYDQSSSHELKHHRQHLEHEKPVSSGDRKDSIDKILTKIEREAATSDKIRSEVNDNEQDSGTHVTTPINSNLKKHGLDQTLRKVRRKLPATQRSFSKIIHQPIVEQISDVAGATIARPSGILAAGLFSLLTSIVILLLCRYYGYEYNFTIGLMALVGGFVLGLLMELVLRATTRRKSR